MMSSNKIKSVMYWVLTAIFVSGVNGQVIDLNEPQEVNENSLLIENINKHEAIKYVAQKYQKIAITIEDYKVILIFDDDKLINIKEYGSEEVDLELYFSREDITYLFENWESMDMFDKFKFLLRSEMPIMDVMTFGGMLMTMR